MKKEPQLILRLRFCTQSRGRTGTGVTPLVFETSASTDSAIWATGSVLVNIAGAKVVLFSYIPKKDLLNLQDA